MQNDKPKAIYSRKLNKAQKRYTTGEQELLSIVEMLEEFCNILFGQQIIIHAITLRRVWTRICPCKG
jgi:hypothetical protein